ncbi:GGDEF domain-containing protein [Actinotalea sp.]|uniref:GGDEF domain-containing protein n=1 Tax=Actinotalea sp. TaxID=1872145 RepID=UPI003569616B
MDDATRTTDGAAPGHRSELQAVRSFVVAMCVAGAIIPAITLAVEPVSMTQTIGFAVIAAGMAGTGLLVWAVRRPRRWLLEIVAQWGTLLVGGNIVLMPTVGIMPVYLLWPMVLVAYVGSLRVLVGTYLWAMTVLGVAVVLNPPTFGTADVMIGMGSTLAIIAGIVWIVTQRQARLREELEIAARTDPLTGLLNRRAFLPWLGDGLARAAEQDLPFTVVMLDLDHFKSINDRLGHFGGDRLLVEVAKAMRGASRGDDVLCRFGGEEFAVGLPGATADEARGYAARLSAALALAGAQEGCVLTVSVGVASRVGECGVEELLHGADEALYAAKRAGRNRAAIWDGSTTVDPAFPAPLRG